MRILRRLGCALLVIGVFSTFAPTSSGAWEVCAEEAGTGIVVCIPVP